jgi:hypothetical protein
MKAFFLGLAALSVPALVSAVPPPRVAPTLRVELAAKPGPMILEIFAAEQHHRVDYRSTPSALNMQLYWSGAEMKSFTGFLMKHKLATRGTVALKADSEPGKQMIDYIHKHVIAPAAAKGNVDAAKLLLQLQEKQKDMNR